MTTEEKQGGVLAVSNNSSLAVIPTMEVSSHWAGSPSSLAPISNTASADPRLAPACSLPSPHCSSSSGPGAGSPPDTTVLHSRITDELCPKLREAERSGRKEL